jgi:hypothetical protein
MKPSSLGPRNATPTLGWLLVVFLAVAIALIYSLVLPTNAQGYAPDEPLELEGSSLSAPAADFPASHPVGGSSQPDPGVGTSAESTAWLTYTVSLPLIRHGYWEAPPSLLGVQLYNGHDSQEALGKAAQAGTRWARFPISWASIEPTNTEPISYQWPVAFDNSLARLAAKNIRVILTLTNNPSWAATYPGGPIDLADNSELAQFMTAAVDRYGRPPYDVKYWEFYNEPDNGSEFYAELGWGYFGNDPEAYAEMLAAVYAPMKAADPEAHVLFGGLSYDNWTSDGGPFVEEFLDDVLWTLQNLGADIFDVMNFHYYPAFGFKWAQYGPGIIGKATRIRDKLAYYGFDKPLICTEASMWSDAVHGGSHELQSRYVSQLFARSMAADLWATIWYRLVDDGDLGTYKYGLLNYDLSPKPSYDAYYTFARQMAFARYVRSSIPGGAGPNQIETHEFVTQDGSARIILAWTVDDQEHDTWLVGDRVLVVDKFGVEITIHDGDDGVTDNRVWVTIGPSPLYLRRGE